MLIQSIKWRLTAELIKQADIVQPQKDLHWFISFAAGLDPTAGSVYNMFIHSCRECITEIHLHNETWYLTLFVAKRPAKIEILAD